MTQPAYHKPYDVRHLKFEERHALCYRAKELAHTWWADKLDCNESFRRQRIEMEFDEIMQKMDDRTHFVFIHRIYSGDYLEIAFRTMTGEPDYFLWIQTDKEHIPTLVEEFDIKEYPPT